MDVASARKMLRNVVSREFPYRGRILNLRVDQIKFPSGDIKPREVIEHCPAAAILAVDADGYIYLVSQYRHAVDEMLYEVPAGLAETGEDIAVTAARELQEEIGFKAGTLRRLFSLYSSPGFTDEEVIFFFATDLTPSKLPQDCDEHLEVFKFTLDEAKALIAGGQIKDGKTVVAVYWYESQRLGDNAAAGYRG